MEKMTKEQVYTEINEAHRIWGSRKTATPENIMGIIRGMSFVLAKCPDDCVVMVHATISEAERRLVYAELGR